MHEEQTVLFPLEYGPLFEFINLDFLRVVSELHNYSNWTKRIHLTVIILMHVFLWIFIDRGCDMVTWRYELSLRSLVDKYFMSECSKQVKYFSTREKKFCISKQPCYSIYYVNTNGIPNHFAIIFFYCGRSNLLYNHSNSDLFTRKITCYLHMWRYHVFACNFTWYFIAVCIIRIIIKIPIVKQ